MAWHRIAHAIDRVGPELLGCGPLDLGRLAEITRAVNLKKSYLGKSVSNS